MAEVSRWSLRRHPRAAELVARRARLNAALRAWLDTKGFVEADPPALLPHAGQEPHLQPPRAELAGLPGPLWLQTSPELCLKRLVCAGLRRVYSLGPAFRGGREELSRLHQPQFTMLEWYRPGETVQELVDDLRGLGRAAAEALERPPPGDGRLISLDEACREFAGCSLEPLLDGDLVAFARAVGWPAARADEPPDQLLGRLLVERIEPGLAREPGWAFLHGFPACAAALARLDPDDPRLALRVEGYLGGLELANGFVELADSEEQRRRWLDEGRRREGPAPPLDEGLLADLADPGLPPTVGMALGVDRLALALLGGDRLRDVLPFALELETGADRDPQA